MNYQEHKKKLDELYKIAVDQKDVGQALVVLEAMIVAGAAEANKNIKA